MCYEDAVDTFKKLNLELPQSKKQKKELIEQYGELSKIVTARAQRLRWLEYVGKVKAEKTAKQV